MLINKYKADIIGAPYVVLRHNEEAITLLFIKWNIPLYTLLLERIEIGRVW